MSRAPLLLRDCGGLKSLLDREASELRYHRIEVEHALRLANLKQEETQQILVNGFEANLSRLEDISYQLDELKEVVVDGFSALEGGIYQLHLDNLGTQAILNDILSCILDKDAFKRELEARKRREEERLHVLETSGQYQDAMRLTQRALIENDQGKAGAMLDEAIMLFERACKHKRFSLQSHFQLGYLYQIHRGNLEVATTHYCESLGEPYSSHNVRVVRHLAHLDYCQEHYNKALERMADFVKHMKDIDAFAADLAKAHKQPWPVCMDALEQAFQTHAYLLKRCTILDSILTLFRNERRFTATENFKESYSDIIAQLQEIKPDLKVLFDGARYAARTGNNTIAKDWLEQMHHRLSSLNSRRVMLLEAMACEDFDNA